jgi:aryl-alcohol dehydrogenase-like predicted oxidoreductase
MLPGMREISLGDSGARVSALCLGTMFFGTTVDVPTSFRLLDRYYEAGGRFLDTADIYAFWVDGCEGGESESLLGRWMEQRGNRDELFLATKVGAAPDDDLTPATIRRGAEASLRRLKTDRIDLFYAHKDDRSVPLEETVGGFGELVADGTVHHLGCSNTMAWRIERARAIAGAARYCCVQQRHSYLRPRPGAHFEGQLASSDELLDYVESEGITLLAYAALITGAYSRADRPVPDGYAGPEADARLAALREVAGETGATPNQVVLAWMMQGTPPVIPLIGASGEEQLAENLGALDVELSAEQLERLSAA